MEDISHDKPNQGHTSLNRKKRGESRQQIPPKEASCTSARETGGRFCAVTKEQFQLRILKTFCGAGNQLGALGVHRGLRRVFRRKRCSPSRPQ